MHREAESAKEDNILTIVISGLKNKGVLFFILLTFIFLKSGTKYLMQVKDQDCIKQYDLSSNLIY
ncbi:hypothetical protein ATB97_14940 [Elizabethkingia bruuniana]|nr:hypothetical protein AYC65_02555 [Elizabethkingia bruuniana]ATL43469.1 hypothetical protein CQS02_09235 [Elizabethkingia miricola]KGO08600.1 hypothetical protein KS04_18705 [Elizabethkingia miricola]KUY28218.1 hypothetical protein ATB97_14940 [Elizabethkingia bruuniana]OPB64387.1 hypothetical protein BAY12_06195 [Elizabethkingia bruuniana]